ncbi:KEOPS complex subunit Pcc1 [Candidatus Nanosalina sp. VS9-1]|uniref:KEOPS complex subunit Pcc1 n=1 Tax=Candidatus Nanosalina sp. VS9-1 TaxID=3388566 RepID=UPI0039DFABF9
MRAELDIEAERPDILYRCVSPSLVTDENVSYSLEFDDEALNVVFRAESGSIGHLRGSSDTVFRLLSLSKKLLER